MLKHAYLIIAHNEFEVLQRLALALDNENHDIYIHFDAKVKELPMLKVEKSSLFILKERVDICWGNITQLEAEYKLWQIAYENNEYAFYHLISGQHYPLRSAFELYKYFSTYFGYSIFLPMYTYEEEIDAKIRRYNFFAKYMMSGKNRYSYKVGRFLWNMALKPQKIFNVRRYKNESFYKTSNWCSLTSDAVKYMLDNKENILLKYRHTFCADEFFVLSELMNSYLKEKCMFDMNMLKVEFVARVCS